jgi:hypothetical protein
LFVAITVRELLLAAWVASEVAGLCAQAAVAPTNIVTTALLIDFIEILLHPLLLELMHS